MGRGLGFLPTIGGRRLGTTGHVSVLQHSGHRIKSCSYFFSSIHGLCSFLLTGRIPSFRRVGRRVSISVEVEKQTRGGVHVRLAS